MHCVTSRRRPTVVVVFGDHWPNYSYLDYTELWRDEPNSTYSQTGYFVSSLNYTLPAQAHALTSPNWLHLDILASARIPTDIVGDELGFVRRAIPVLGVYKRVRGGAALSRQLPEIFEIGQAEARYREVASAVLGHGLGLH
jgi:hypothetical protein